MKNIIIIFIIILIIFYINDLLNPILYNDILLDIKKKV